jgi:putative DNA primase/helicase
MTALDRQLTVTFFRDKFAYSRTVENVSLRDLIPRLQHVTAGSKADLPWLKLATFGDMPSERSGSLRHDRNVLAVDGIEGDYDGGVLSPEETALMLEMSGVAAVIYTSPSHANARPRYRILCPLSRPHPPTDRERFLSRLNGALDGVLAGESFTLSQSYYLGSVAGNPEHRVLAVDGRPIDACDDLDAIARGRPTPTPGSLPTLTLPPGVPPDERAQAALAAAAGAFARRGEVDRHRTLLAATLLVAPFIKSGHLQVDAVAEALTSAMAEDGRDPNDGEIEGAIRGALPKVQAYEPPTGGAEFPAEDPPEHVEVPEFSQVHLSIAFAECNANRFKYDHDERMWYRFTPGLGWEQDRDGAVPRAVRAFVGKARDQCGNGKDTIEGTRIAFHSAVEQGARVDPAFATTRDKWDANPWLLGVPGAVLDLRTGEAVPATADRLVCRRTAVAPAEPGVRSKLWERVLLDATAGDHEFVAWLQRWVGYCLTGDMREEVLVFVYGPGGSGKGTFLRTVAGIFGQQYSYQAPAELFKADSRMKQEYQLAVVDGKRLLMASETEAGTALAEAFVKELTGNEGEINARNPYGRPYTFRSQAKLMIVGNHAPTLRGRSDAMSRRLRVVPFDHPPAAPDRTLNPSYARHGRDSLAGVA